MKKTNVSKLEHRHGDTALRHPWSLWLGYLNQPISCIPGVGSVSAHKLSRLNIRCFKDLLFHFPTRHQIFENGDDAAHQSLNITIQTCILGPKYILVRAKTIIEKQDVSLFFHKKQHTYFKTRMIRGSSWTIWGKGSFSNARWTFFFPRSKPFDQMGGPISETTYPQTEGLSSRSIHAWVKQILRNMPSTDEWLPVAFIAQKNWPSHQQALNIMHHLDNTCDTQRATAFERLSFDRILARHVLSMHLRRKKESTRAISCQVHTDRFIKILSDHGFTLTPSQAQARSEIEEDLARTYPMRRLLQGDVGSGKTLVALGAMMTALDSGARVAFLAPTEILAQQVHRIYTTLDPKNAAQSALLTSSSPRKKQLIQRIAEGHHHVVIGTHALLRQDVHIPDLGLVIIDEQQRFGVAQRARLLSGQGHIPHVLLMTATPIPRTHSLMMRGHIDTSYLKARVPSLHKTHLLDASRLREVIEKVKGAVQQGKQIFWICSCVEENEDKAAVKLRFENLKNIFQEHIGCLYSQQPNCEKQETLSLFREGHIKLLIASTVVEIGIDVPNASHMIIEDIQQFGLSQLHQLRGRIGRQGQESVLLGLYKTPLSQHARQRLTFFAKYDDGFDIAQKDLLLRGEGDITGTNQSGFLDPRFSFSATMAKDAEHMAKQLTPGARQSLLELFEHQEDIHCAHSA
jgi:ATP-dependent DNA helicase RecG